MANDMNIVPPVPGTTPGPAWAQEINDILVDQVSPHNHTGNPNGVQLGTAALNIDNDLSLNNHALLDVNAVELSPYTSAFLRSLYSTGTDLFYKNGSGTAVQITSGSTLNATLLNGTGITNLTAPAQANYNAGTFRFLSNSTTVQYAQLWGSDVKIYNGASLNPLGAVILDNPHVLASDKTIVLPPNNLTLPQSNPVAQTQVVAMSTTGVMSASPVYSDIDTNTVTNPLTIGGTTYINSSFNGSGKLVMFALVPKKGAINAFALAKNDTGAAVNTPINFEFQLTIAGSTANGCLVKYRLYDPLVPADPTGGVRTNVSFTFYYQPAGPGIFTYSLVGTKASNNYRVEITDYVLQVVEVIGGLNGGF